MSRYVSISNHYCVLAASGAVGGPGAPPSSPPAAPTSHGTGASTASSNQLADNKNNLIIERTNFHHSCCWSQITNGHKYKVLVYCFIESVCDCFFFLAAASPRFLESRDSTTRLRPVDLISVYTASRSRTEPMQCTNLTSRVVRAPFTLNPT